MFSRNSAAAFNLHKIRLAKAALDAQESSLIEEIRRQHTQNFVATSDADFHLYVEITQNNVKLTKLTVVE